MSKDTLKKIRVFSSNGEFTIDMAGNILEKDVNDDYYIQRIHVFDVDEYLKYWNLSEPAPSIDILNLGYWWKEGDKMKYEPAAQDWREKYAGDSGIVMPCEIGERLFGKL